MSQNFKVVWLAWELLLSFKHPKAIVASVVTAFLCSFLWQAPAEFLWWTSKYGRCWGPEMSKEQALSWQNHLMVLIHIAVTVGQNHQVLSTHVLVCVLLWNCTFLAAYIYTWLFGSVQFSSWVPGNFPPVRFGTPLLPVRNFGVDSVSCCVHCLFKLCVNMTFVKFVFSICSPNSLIKE